MRKGIYLNLINKGVLLFLLMLFTTTIFSQEIEKHDILIDGIYGFPNFKTTGIGSLAPNEKTSLYSIGPLGGKLEYIFLENDKFKFKYCHGIGFSYYYANGVMSYIHDSYDYRVDMYSQRYLLHYAFHQVSKRADIYSTYGLGFAKSWYVKSSEDQSFIRESDDVTVIPVALRVAFGIRYFVTPYLGGNFEFGFGSGAWFVFGLSTKI